MQARLKNAALGGERVSEQAPARGQDTEHTAQKGPKAGQVSGVAPRKAALAALEASFLRRQPLDEAFDPLRAKLTPADAGLAWAICQEVAREHLRLKTLKQAFLKRRLPKNAAAGNLILDIALVQLLKMDGAPHAVITTAVELAKRDKRPAVRTLANLINGVLRNVQRRRDAGDLYLPPPIKALPQWLAQRWQKQFGYDGAVQLAEAFLTPPGLHITPKNAAAMDALLAHPEALKRGSGVHFPPGTSPMILPGFQTGGFWVQDRCAAVPAAMLAPEDGAACYDLCAAPGGKTLQLAAMGADVTAIDIAGARLAKLSENLRRTGLPAKTEKADLLEWTAPAPAPFILLDAPCTALGTFQRHPDVLHHRRAADLEAMAERQSALLDTAWKALSPGGTLVYAVCSLEPEEGSQQIDAFLARTPGAKITPVKPSDFTLAAGCETTNGCLLTAPHFLMQNGGGDGFFIAKLTRNS